VSKRSATTPVPRVRYHNVFDDPPIAASNTVDPKLTILRKRLRAYSRMKRGPVAAAVKEREMHSNPPVAVVAAAVSPSSDDGDEQR
jgi:hypothetical protein